MESWPVTERCSKDLAKLLPTHNLCPLPAYDKKGRLIPPMQYESMLKGATIEVCFAFIHHYIKTDHHHIYMAMVRELRILRSPAPLPTSPFKKICVSASKGKGKQCEIWKQASVNKSSSSSPLRAVSTPVQVFVFKPVHWFLWMMCHLFPC